MRGKTLAIGIIVGVVIITDLLGFLYYGTFNSLVSFEEAVNEKWAEVAQELQRRYDLIPWVVNASKFYIQYEGSVLEEITRLRSQWSAAMQGGNCSSIDNATENLESGVSQLIVVFEAYPT